MPIVGSVVRATGENFGVMVRDDSVLVDKSLGIKEFWEGEYFSLITRPRRFGKSLTLSMFQHFFAEQVGDLPTQGLFDQFAIAKKYPDFMKEHQGRYPVILVSFKDVRVFSYQSAVEKFRVLFKEVYSEYEYLLKQKIENISDNDRLVFTSFLEGRIKDEELPNALKTLTRFLYKAHGNKQVIVLIDEYDAPLSAAYKHHEDESSFLDKLGEFMGSVLSTTLKSNIYVKRGLMTGVLRITQSGMLSGLNNFVSYTVLDDKYPSLFGFSKKEVRELIWRDDLRGKNQKKVKKILQVMKTSHGEILKGIKAFYNGYKIGGKTIYNPLSIMQYLAHNNKLAPHWVLTSDNHEIKTLLLESSIDVKNKLRTLILKEGDGTIDAEIDVNLRYSDLMEKPDAIWTLLLFAGYLTVEEQMHEDPPRYRVKIPNTEVLKQYKKVFSEGLKEQIEQNNPGQYTRLLNSLLKGEVKKFTELLNQFMKRSLSVTDVGGTKSGPEQFYHGFVMGLLTGIDDEKYEISSNKEGGDGFYDGMITPLTSLNGSMGIILEFKRIEEKCADSDKLSLAMQSKAEKAVQQIDERRYQDEYLKQSYAHISSVLKVGLVFSGKSVVSAYKITHLETKKDSKLEFTDFIDDLDIIPLSMIAAPSQADASSSMNVDTEVSTNSPSLLKMSQASKSSADKKRKRPEGSFDALSLPVVTTSKAAKKAPQATPSRVPPSE